MRKIAYIFAAVALLVSCGNNPRAAAPAPQDPLLLAVFGDQWVKDHPSLLNNEITRQEGLAEFAAAFILEAENHPELISQLPVRFEGMAPYSGGNEYAVKFQYSELGRPALSPAWTISFGIVARIPKAAAAALKEKAYYNVSGKVAGFATSRNFRLPSGGSAVANSVLAPDVFDSKKPDFMLNNVVLEGLEYVEAAEK